MNHKNLEFLQDQVKYTGFGENLENDLARNVEQGQPEFQLKYETKYDTDSVEATLNFTKSEKSDMYFFNSYRVALDKENPGENFAQTFYINRGNNITLKEAYNMMEGRSVFKELTKKDPLMADEKPVLNDDGKKIYEKYSAWQMLDFKHADNNGDFRIKKFSENFGYDIEAALSKHPIKELERNDFKDNLLDSLKKGNKQSVTFQVDGTEQKHYVEANPQFKTINVYDGEMRRVGQRETKSEKQSESENLTNNTRKKESQAPSDQAPGTSKKTSKKNKGQSV